MRIGSVALSLLVGTAFALMGNGLLSTLAAVRLADASISESASGWILSGYFAGLTFGTLLLTPTIQRIGGVRAFAAFAAVGIIAALAHGLIPPGWSWLFLRGLSGLSMAGLYMTIESWLNSEATSLNRGRVMAAYLVSIYVGTGSGQLMLPFWPATGLEGFAFAAVSISIAATLVSITRVDPPPLHAMQPLKTRSLLRIAPLGWLGAWLSGIIAGTIYASIPLSSRTHGLSTTEVSYLMAAYVLGGMCGQWPFGRLSDHMDRRGVLLFVVVVLSACCFATPWVNAHWSEARWPLAFVFGAVAFSIYPLAVAHTLDRVGADQSLPAASQMLLSSSIGAVIGPIVASSVSGAFGADAFYVANGLLFAGFAVISILRMASVSRVAQEPFVSIPRTTVTVHELDPRVDTP